MAPHPKPHDADPAGGEQRMDVPRHVEARSLSSLNFLAANPPQYPVNPAGDRHEPLVLYLSRVPGSRGPFPRPACRASLSRILPH